MVLTEVGRPLELRERAPEEPGPGQVRLAVRACAVCRTDLHLADGELEVGALPRVLGHQIVGVVEAHGAGAGLEIGQRVGVPWLGWSCGACRFCQRGQENLCERARFTGWQIDGGFAERCLADARYCLPLPRQYGDVEAAPLLCGGLIGYRALRAAGSGVRLGLYGFGAAAHLVAQLAHAEGRRVFAFTRPGDAAAQALALELGCVWAGASTARPPELLDAAILFAPVGALVPVALAAVDRGGIVVCAGIHMSDLPSFPYSLLWGERVLRSVANLTRRDGEELLSWIERAHLDVRATCFPLDQANRALASLRDGRLVGSAVLAM